MSELKKLNIKIKELGNAFIFMLALDETGGRNRRPFILPLM